GRNFSTESDDLVGLFINTLPLRVAVNDDDNVVEWLQSLRRQQAAVRPHEHVALAAVQSLSEMPRGLPLFETVVVYDHRTLDAQLQARGVKLCARRFEYTGQTNFPLSVIAYGDDEMLLRLEYSRERLADSTVERLLGHLFTLLTHLASGTARRVRDLQMLTAS